MELICQPVHQDLCKTIGSRHRKKWTVLSRKELEGSCVSLTMHILLVSQRMSGKSGYSVSNSLIWLKVCQKSDLKGVFPSTCKQIKNYAIN